MPQEIVFTDKPTIQFTDAPTIPEAVAPLPSVAIRAKEQREDIGSFTGGTLGAPLRTPKATLLKMDAKSLGYGVEGAPWDVMAKWSFTPRKLENASHLLTESFGTQVPVQMDKRLGVMTYVNPTTKKITLFREPGISEETILGNLDEIPIMAAEAWGALKGSRAGWAGTAAGAGLGAFSGKYSALKFGKTQGYHQASELDMIGEATLTGVFGLGFGLAGEAAGAIFRRVIGGVPEVKKLLGQLDEVQIESALDNWQPMIDEIKERTGNDLRPVLSQVLREESATEAAKRTITMAQRLERESVAAANQQKGFLDAEQNLVDRLVPDNVKAIDNTAEQAASQEIRETASDVANKEMMAIENVRDEAVAQGEKELSTLFDGPDLVATADQIQTTIQTARQQTRESLSVKYKEFWTDVPEGTEVSLEPLRKIGQEWKDRFDEDIFGSLSEGDKQIVMDAVNAGMKDGVDVPADMSVVSRALSALKAEKRAIAKGEAPKTKDIRFINDMIGSLQGIRNEALEGLSPVMRVRLESLDQIYAQTEGLLSESMVNRILIKDAQGGAKPLPIPMMQNLLGGSGRPAQQLKKLMKDPNAAGFGEMPVIQDGAFALYRNKVLKNADGEARTGKALMAAHKSFMETYGAGIKELMPAANFTTAKNSMKWMDAAEAELRIGTKKINKSFENTLGDSGNFDNLVDYITSGGNTLGKTTKLKNLLAEKHPQMWESYKDMRMKRVLDDISGRSPTGQKYYDSGKLTNLLEKSGRSGGELEKLYGKQYVSDLRMLRNLMEMKTPIPGVSMTEAQKMITEGKVPEGSVSLVRRLFLGPLSRAGYVLTGIRGIGREQSLKATAMLVANPEMLVRQMRMYRRGTIGRNAEAFYAQLGLHQLANMVSEEE